MKNDTTAALYLLTGPEEGDKAAFINDLIKKKAAELKEQPEIYRYYPFESNMLDIVTILSTDSLFAAYKFVILYRVDEIKIPAEIKLLEEYCRNPSDTACLILISSQVNLSSSKITNAVPSSNRKIYWELDHTKKKSWVFSYFKQKNLSIDPAALDFFLEIVESNTRDLRQECNKLINFFSPGSTITTNDIELYVYHSKEENVFTLFEKIAARDLAGCLEIFDKIVASGEDVSYSFFGGLLWQLRKVYSYKLMSASHYQTDEIFKSLAITSKKSQKIYQAAHKNYTKAEITQILILLAEYEKKLRIFRTDSHTLLIQLFLYYTIKNGGRVVELEEARWY